MDLAVFGVSRCCNVAIFSPLRPFLDRLQYLLLLLRVRACLFLVLDLRQDQSRPTLTCLLFNSRRELLEIAVASKRLQKLMLIYLSQLQRLVVGLGQPVRQIVEVLRYPNCIEQKGLLLVNLNQQLVVHSLLDGWQLQYFV